MKNLIPENFSCDSLRVRWLSILGLVALTACVTVSSSSTEAVKQRAGERWRALVAVEFEKAYAYSTPGFRSVVTITNYIRHTGGAVKWKAAEVNKVSCAELTKCDVQIRLDYQPLMGGKPGATYSTYLDETWLFEDGQWWVHLPIGSY